MEKRCDHIKCYPACYGPPKYDSDLNAMSEARNILSSVQQQDFARRMLSRFRQQGTNATVFLCIDAPASIQAEQFLKTIGTWKE